MKKVLTNALVCLAVWATLSGAPARADFIPISLPDATYQSSTTLLPITAPNFTTFSSLSNAEITVTSSIPLEARTVPGGGWATWSSPPFSETATPRVGFTGVTVTSFTLNLTPSAGNVVTTFGVEMEPNIFQTFTLGANFFNGATLVGSISLNVAGTSGARLFAGATTTEQFTSVQLTAPAAAQGFAIAQVRYDVTPAGVPTGVPEPSSLMLVGLGVAGLGVYGWRRQRKQRAA